MNILQLELSQVRVAPDRFRQPDPKKVEDIAISYLKFGQLQPIIVVQAADGLYDLVDGAHRVAAKTKNNDTHVAAVLRDEVDELFLREMELEVNIKRKEMPWQEQQKALAKLHKMKAERDPNWGLAQTAELAGESRGKVAVSEAVKLIRMMEMFPELEKAKSVGQAMKWMREKAKSIVRVIDVKNNKLNYELIEEKLWLGDSVERIKEVPDYSFDLILTDPPFGIDYDNRKDGTSGSLTSYDDDEVSYRRLLSMAPDLYRVIKPDGWLIWFFGVSWYDECKRAFREAGFTVDELPIIWDRSEGRAFTTHPEHYFGRAYDMALHCFKGDPGIVMRKPILPNIIRVAPLETGERETLVERPIELYAEFIRRLTIKGQSVADFFVGSGSCCAAAARLGRDFFGCELDPERRAYAIKKVRAHLPDDYVGPPSGEDEVVAAVSEGAT